MTLLQGAFGDGLRRLPPGYEPDDLRLIYFGLL